MLVKFSVNFACGLRLEGKENKRLIAIGLPLADVVEIELLY